MISLLLLSCALAQDASAAPASPAAAGSAVGPEAQDGLEAELEASSSQCRHACRLGPSRALHIERARRFDKSGIDRYSRTLFTK